MRLLGDHVPYAVEAWPEGGQRHLSAESGLYCRTVTEGLFGIEPTGFNSFTLQPRLPKKWNRMSLEHIKAFQKDLTITITRSGPNEKILIATADRPVKEYIWDGKNPISIIL
jgi:cellobiose phosphorylase